MTVLRLPATLNVENVPSVEAGSHLLVDLTDVGWTYPSGFVALACLARDAANLEVRWPSGRDQQRYLSRMHLDQVLRSFHAAVPPLPSVRHRRAELCELSFFSEMRDVDRVADLVRSHADRARFVAEWAWALEEGTWEICVNALTHSHWGGGFVAAQHYEARDEIEYAVADAGIGIMRSLEGQYSDVVDDESAILRAREYGVSRFGQDVQGAGLSETVDQVNLLGGRVVVRSGTAMVTFDRNGHSTRFTSDPWNGTLVKVVLTLPG